MKNSIKKMVGIILTIIFVIAIIPSFTHAVDSETEAVMLEKDEGYIIYIKGLKTTDFKYAFSNSEEATDDLVYTTCQTDTNGENVAYLEKSETETYNYMFIATSGEDGEVTTTTVELATLKSITEEEIAQIDALTTKIAVDTEKTYSYSTTAEDGTTVTTTVGKIVITEEGDYAYQYQLIELNSYDTNSTVTSVNETAEELYEQITALETASDMYDKLSIMITIRDDVASLLENASWEDVKDLAILQPEEAQKGEKYIVLIQKLDGSNVEESDIQIMTCARVDDEGAEYTNVTSTEVVEKKTALPVTGENLALYIALAIIIVAIIVIAVRMKYLKGKSNGKH